MDSDLFNSEFWHGFEHLNPYNPGVILSAPPEFVDRKDALRRILSSVITQRGGVIHLRGDYRIGKSSVLRRFERLLKEMPSELRRDRSGRLLECHALTCEQLLIGSETRSLLGVFRAALGEVLPDECSGKERDELALFMEALTRATSDQRHAIFLIDEAELLPQIQGTGEWMGCLREVVTRFSVHFVLTSVSPLIDFRWSLCTPPLGEHGHGESQTSAGFQGRLRDSVERVALICDIIQLRPLNIEDAVSLIRLSEQLYGEERSLRGFEELIIDQSGTIPYVLQTSCRELYDVLYEDPETRLNMVEMEQRRGYLRDNPRAVVRGEDGDTILEDNPASLGHQRKLLLRTRTYDQLEAVYFRVIWDRLLSQQQREFVVSLTNGLTITDLNQHSVGASLLDRGYLRERGNRVWLSSRLFDQFLSEHHRGRREAPTPMMRLRAQARPREPLAVGRGLVPRVLWEQLHATAERWASRCPREGDGLADSELSFRTLLTHTLTYLSQFALAAFVGQPDIQTPEICNTLWNNRYRPAGDGSRLRMLQELASLSNVHPEDPLSKLACSLTCQRSVNEFESDMGSLCQLSNRQRAPATLLEFLELVVWLRNLQAHPESAPVPLSEVRRVELLSVAFAGLQGVLRCIARDTRDFGLATMESFTEQNTFRLSMLADKGQEGGSVEASIDGHVKVAPNLGDLHPVYVTGSRLMLCRYSMTPHMVTGARMRTLAGGKLESDKSRIHLLTAADKNKLVFTPLGDVLGRNLVITANDGHIFGYLHRNYLDFSRRASVENSEHGNE